MEGMSVEDVVKKYPYLRTPDGVSIENIWMKEGCNYDVGNFEIEDMSIAVMENKHLVKNI